LFKIHIIQPEQLSCAMRPACGWATRAGARAGLRMADLIAFEPGAFDDVPRTCPGYRCSGLRRK